MKISSDEKVVGFGYRSPFVIDAPFERVWAAMVDKVYNTSKYLPVVDVKTEDHSTYVYREMTIPGKKSDEDQVHGRTYKQKIYLDKENAEIRFLTIDMDEMHVHKFHKTEKVLEYYLANKKGDRQYWNALQQWVHDAMLTTQDMAMAYM